ncbi:MAG TPA: T9SS type A sorting domain-containing protein, partial [Saprospiraceae bacterium]|nr:T9SS type A sorting domain-containing protein [Saprospiraceae bacterium]
LLNATISVDQASGKVGIFPNPTADGYANLEIDLPQESDVTANIYDLQGNLLEEVLDGYFKFQNVALNLSELPAGSYLLKVFIDGTPITRKIVRLK